MSENTPSSYQLFSERYPDFLAGYEHVNRALRAAPGLDDKEIALTKLAISVGAGLEGAIASHTRKALELGIEPSKLEHVALMALPTRGLPHMMMCWKAVRKQIEP